MNLGSMNRGIFRNGGILGDNAQSNPTWSYAGRTKIYDVRSVKALEAQNLTGKFLVGNYLTANNDPTEEIGPKLVNHADGVVDWTADSTNIDTVLTGTGGGFAVEDDGLSAWVHWGAEDGGFATAGREILQQIRISDGVTLQTFANADSALGAAERAVIYNGDLDEVAHLVTDSADEIWIVDAATATTAFGGGNDGTISTAASLGKTTGNNWLVGAGSNGHVSFWDWTSTITTNPEFTIDLQLTAADPQWGGNTINAGGFDRGISPTDTPPRITPDRTNDDQCFISVGRDTTNYTPAIYKLDVAAGNLVAADTVIAERDLTGDVSFGGNIQLVDHAVDNLGRVFCLVQNTVFDTEILVLSNDLSAVLFKFDEDLGLTLPQSGGTAVAATCICVDEVGNVTIGDEDAVAGGNVWRYPFS